MSVGENPPPAPSGTPWAPANDVEVRLYAAVHGADLAEVMGIIAAAPLFLPGFPDEPGGGQRLLTRERDGVPYLLVFTSVETLHRVVGAAGWRETTLPELVRAWPSLATEPWGLAVNPTTPIGVLAAPDEVPTLVPATDALTSFAPANEVEAMLRDALLAPDGEVLLDVLVTSRVTVPTRALEVDGVWTVPVFTSLRRCEEYLAAVGIDVPIVELDFVEVLRQWPDSEYRLAINPGSPIGFSVDGNWVPALLAHAAELAHRLRNATAPAGSVPTTGSTPETPGDVADLLRGRG